MLPSITSVIDSSDRPQRKSFPNTSAKGPLYSIWSSMCHPVGHFSLDTDFKRPYGHFSSQRPGCVSGASADFPYSKADDRLVPELDTASSHRGFLPDTEPMPRRRHTSRVGVRSSILHAPLLGLRIHVTRTSSLN